MRKKWLSIRNTSRDRETISATTGEASHLRRRDVRHRSDSKASSKSQSAKRRTKHKDKGEMHVYKSKVRPAGLGSVIVS